MSYSPPSGKEKTLNIHSQLRLTGVFGFHIQGKVKIKGNQYPFTTLAGLSVTLCYLFRFFCRVTDAKIDTGLVPKYHDTGLSTKVLGGFF